MEQLDGINKNVLQPNRFKCEELSDVFVYYLLPNCPVSANPAKGPGGSGAPTLPELSA